MKILVSSQGNSKDSQVDLHFGRSEYFVIYDDQEDTYEAIQNDGVKQSSGAGVKASQIAINQDVDYLITGSLGPKAFTIIDSSKILVFKSNEGSVEEAITAFKNNQLNELCEAGKEQKTRGRS